MGDQSNIRHASDSVHVSCHTCLKEIPLSEALVPEANDYFVHFCGLVCFEKWKQREDIPEPSSKHSAERIP